MLNKQTHQCSNAVIGMMSVELKRRNQERKVEAHLNLNSPLLAGGMNIECDLFLVIGVTQ